MGNDYKSNLNSVGYLDSVLDVIKEGVYISDYTGKTLKINRAYHREGKYSVALNPDIMKTGRPKTSVFQTTKTGRKVVFNGYQLGSYLCSNWPTQRSIRPAVPENLGPQHLRKW